MNLELVPNSGHHFLFVPLAVNDPNKFTRWDVIYHHTSGDTQAWLKAGDQHPDFYQTLADIAGNDTLPWRVHKPWLRYRLGLRKANSPELPSLIGLWLAFETNLGTIQDRGLTIAIDQPDSPVRIDEATYAATCTPPTGIYVANSSSELTCSQEFSLADDFRDMLETCLRDATADDCSLVWGPLPPLTYSWASKNGDSVNIDLVIDFGNTRSVVLAIEELNDIREFGLQAGLRPITFTDEYDQPWDRTAPPSGLVASSFILRTPLFRQLEDHERITFSKGHTQTEERQVSHPVPDDSFLGRLLNRQKNEILTQTETLYFRDVTLTRRPQRFVQLAHAVIGPAMEDALNEAKTQQAISNGASVLQSSPKQFYWDYDPQGTGGSSYWQMLSLPYDADHGRPCTALAGEELEFLPLDGSGWDLDNPPQVNADPGQRTAGNNAGGKATYPRSDTLTWMALSILETAYRQINAGGQERAHIPKKLGGIYLTYPPGWTAQEREGFKAKWDKALNIFLLTHFKDATSQNPTLPQIHLEIDEAVASQLPYLYSEILYAKTSDEHSTTRSKKASTLWFEQVGKHYPVKGTPLLGARIMSLDIGGGTSDVSILQYHERNADCAAQDIAIEATLLYKDTRSIAGNHIVREVIESVLLPALSPDTAAVQQAWDNWNDCPTQTALCQKRLAIRQVLIPIVHFWLARLASNDERPFENPRNGNRFHSPQDMGIQASAWNDLMAHLGLGLDVSTPIPVNEEKINLCLDRVFNQLDNSYLRFIAAAIASFSVDILVVCGKVSELPYLRELLARHLPLDESRIVFYKNYRPGDWYPKAFLTAGAINDPKTTTATGAALFRAFKRSLVPGWSLTTTLANDFSTSNYWRPFPQGDNFFERSPEPTATATLHDIPINTQLGRSQLSDATFKPEPVYKLRWRNQHDCANDNGTLSRLVLRRTIDPNAKSDRLDIVEATGTRSHNGVTQSISTADVELQLCPVTGNYDWQESCQLKLHD